jgi:predicted ATPase
MTGDTGIASRQRSISRSWKGQANFRRDDTVEQRLDKLEALLTKTNTPAEAAPLLADLLSISANERHPLLNISRHKRKENTLAIMLSLVEALADRCPLFLLFEDVHWIDPTSLELLNLIIDRVTTRPI